MVRNASEHFFGREGGRISLQEEPAVERDGEAAGGGSAENVVAIFKCDQSPYIIHTSSGTWYAGRKHSIVLSYEKHSSASATAAAAAAAKKKNTFRFDSE